MLEELVLIATHVGYDIECGPGGLEELGSAWTVSEGRCRAERFDGAKCQLAAVVLPGCYQSGLCREHETARRLLNLLYHGEKTPALVRLLLRFYQAETIFKNRNDKGCLLYTSPSPRDKRQSRMPSSA